MQNTPNSLRKHIALIGKTNAGKSTLFNALLGQDMAIVSSISGTTTDPVSKAMELIPYGPVTLIDTAGLGDATSLGAQRTEKTNKTLKRCDLILSVCSAADEKPEFYNPGSTSSITVFTKCDLVSPERLASLKKEYPSAVFLADYSSVSISALMKKMSDFLSKQESDTETLLGNIVKKGSNVVMVIPIDSAAPKGRIILPQVQAIRDCLDNGIHAISVTPAELPDILSELSHVELVVTDSQAFHAVSETVPENIPLTSFSMLLANQKGRIDLLIDGTNAIPHLDNGDKILMLEACTHSTTHEDIGRVKIPALLEKVTGKKLRFEYFTGYDFPKNLSEYKLAVHCGGCMINKREILSRLSLLESSGVPATNYGVILAYLNGILERASKVFKNQK